MQRRCFFPLLLSSLMWVWCGSAQAQFFSDATLEAAWQSAKRSELERLALPRLTARADDAQAVLAAAMLALQGDDATRRRGAIVHAEKCLELQPKAAACHYALGAVLGVQALSEGMLKLMGSVGRVKGALQEALELAPTWFPARSAMVEFYLQAPGVVGGSVSRARELARSAPSAEQARALEARIALQEERFEAALNVLAQVKAGADTALAADLRGWTVSAALGLVNKGEAAKARAAFERVMAEKPDDALGPYGLARVATDTGQPAQAIALFERAARLQGAERLPIDYRMGIAQQALEQKDAARDSFRRFIAANKGSARSLDDAKKRLAQLGG